MKKTIVLLTLSAFLCVEICLCSQSPKPEMMEMSNEDGVPPVRTQEVKGEKASSVFPPLVRQSFDKEEGFAEDDDFSIASTEVSTKDDESSEESMQMESEKPSVTIEEEVVKGENYRTKRVISFRGRNSSFNAGSSDIFQRIISSPLSLSPSPVRSITPGVRIGKKSATFAYLPPLALVPKNKREIGGSSFVEAIPTVSMSQDRLQRINREQMRRVDQETSTDDIEQTRLPQQQGVLASATQIVLKEPVRFIQFIAKTHKLKKQGHKIPVGFIVSTSLRFVGAMVGDTCLAISMLNNLQETSFLNGTGRMLCTAIFCAGTALNSLSRTVVRSGYAETSSLYGDILNETTATPAVNRRSLADLAERGEIDNEAEDIQIEFATSSSSSSSSIEDESDDEDDSIVREVMRRSLSPSPYINHIEEKHDTASERESLHDSLSTITSEAKRPSKETKKEDE